MSTYLFRVVQTPGTLATLLEKPENRRDANDAFFKNAGGTLLGFWYGLGGTDAYLLGELPDDVVMTGLLARVTASGAFSSVTATRLLTVEEMLTALRGSGVTDYRAPGGAG
jgi:uncharacterized protein with GYD domain